MVCADPGSNSDSVSKYHLHLPDSGRTDTSSDLVFPSRWGSKTVRTDPPISNTHLPAIGKPLAGGKTVPAFPKANPMPAEGQTSEIPAISRPHSYSSQSPTKDALKKLKVDEARARMAFNKPASGDQVVTPPIVDARKNQLLKETLKTKPSSGQTQQNQKLAGGQQTSRPTTPAPPKTGVPAPESARGRRIASQQANIEAQTKSKANEAAVPKRTPAAERNFGTTVPNWPAETQISYSPPSDPRMEMLHQQTYAKRAQVTEENAAARAENKVIMQMQHSLSKHANFDPNINYESGAVNLVVNSDAFVLYQKDPQQEPSRFSISFGIDDLTYTRDVTYDPASNKYSCGKQTFKSIQEIVDNRKLIVFKEQIGKSAFINSDDPQEIAKHFSGKQNGAYVFHRCDDDSNRLKMSVKSPDGPNGVESFRIEVAKNGSLIAKMDLDEDLFDESGSDAIVASGITLNRLIDQLNVVKGGTFTTKSGMLAGTAQASYRQFIVKGDSTL